jgi:DNA polymerase sigma
MLLVIRQVKQLCMDDKYDLFYKGHLHIILKLKKKKIPISVERFHFGPINFYKAVLSTDTFSSTLFSYETYLKKRSSKLAKKEKQETQEKKIFNTSKILRDLHYSSEDFDYNLDLDDDDEANFTQ